jgi:hypothetical protein
MGNTLTDLIPVIHKAGNIVSRELVGLIPAVYLNPSAEQVAKDQKIRYLIVGDGSTEDDAPSATGPDPAAQTPNYGEMSITKVKRAKPFFIEGEEEKGLGTAQYEDFLQQNFAQSMRSLANEMEADGCALYSEASCAYGAVATVPFATAGQSVEAAQLRRLLVTENGAPSGDLQLVLNGTAAANIRGLQGQVQMEGDVSLQRQGILTDRSGFKIRESSAVKIHAAGTNNGAYDVNGQTPAIGQTSIAFDTGTGTVLAGDIIINAESGRDSRKYVVKTALTAGSLAIQNPGLKKAWVDGDTITGTATYNAQMAFDRMAIHLLTRIPAMPKGGDSAVDSYVYTDPVSKISFLISVYAQYRRRAYVVAAAWGWKVVKNEHLAILIS